MYGSRFSFIWVQGVDQSGNTCYTKQEFIHSADGITLHLLLKNHHFQYRYPILFNQRHTNENMNDKENIEQNSLQQGQVIRNTKKRRQTTKATYISPKRSKKNRNKKNVMKLKNTLDNSEQHSNENEDFVLLPASKDILQSNDPNPITKTLTMLKYLLNPSTQLMKTMILSK